MCKWTEALPVWFFDVRLSFVVDERGLDLLSVLLCRQENPAKIIAGKRHQVDATYGNGMSSHGVIQYLFEVAQKTRHATSSHFYCVTLLIFSPWRQIWLTPCPPVGAWSRSIRRRKGRSWWLRLEEALDVRKRWRRGTAPPTACTTSTCAGSRVSEQRRRFPEQKGATWIKRHLFSLIEYNHLIMSESATAIRKWVQDGS